MDLGLAGAIEGGGVSRGCGVASAADGPTDVSVGVLDEAVRNEVMEGALD